MNTKRIEKLSNKEIKCVELTCDIVQWTVQGGFELNYIFFFSFFLSFWIEKYTRSFHFAERHQNRYIIISSHQNDTISSFRLTSYLKLIVKSQ